MSVIIRHDPTPVNVTIRSRHAGRNLHRQTVLDTIGHTLDVNRQCLTREHSVTTKLYTTAELAEVLRESERTTLRRITRGEIESVDVGTDRRPRLRVTQAELDAFLERRTRAAVAS